MSGRAASSENNISANNDNQPMDLAQKSYSNRSSEGNVIKGSTLVQFGSSQLLAGGSSLASKSTKNESTGVFSRHPNQGALNLAVSSNTTISVSSRAVSNATSASHATSGFHIPRGAAVVANMTASRSQNLSSIIRTTSQVMQNSATRTNIISQKMVPISNNSWSAKNTSTTAVLTTRASTTQLCGRATITPSRTVQNPVGTISAFQTGPLRTGNVVSGAIKSHIPPLRVGSSAEILKPHPPKGIQITHPVSHTQKFINNSASNAVRGIGNASHVPPGSGGSSVYTPSSTLVTSLASSGTTITPHPGNRSYPNTVRLTSTSSILSQGTSQGQSGPIGGICLTPSGGAILAHHPHSVNRGHSVEHVPLKTPIVRSSHPLTHNLKGSATNILPAGTHISFTGSKVVSQNTPVGGVPLAVAQLSNVTVSKTQGAILSTQNAGLTSVPFHQRPGATLTPPMGRGSGSTISMTKVVPQVKGAVGLNNTVTSGLTVPHSSLTSNSQDSQTGHGNVFIQRTSQHAGASTSQPEKNVVTHYSITTPYYMDSTSQATLPVNASIVPSNHYLSSGSVGSGMLRIGSSGPGSNPSTGESVPLLKTNSSPRPSILRKRTDVESNAPIKAAKNLSTALNIPLTSPPSPVRPDSRGNGNVSSGSTTISANSSPGMQINEDDAAGIATTGSGGVSRACKLDGGVPFDDATSAAAPSTGGAPPCVINVPLASRNSNSHTAVGANDVMKFLEAAERNVAAFSSANGSAAVDGMSPRKKPRKQTLMGNELHEARSVEELFEHPVVKKIKKEVPPPVKKAAATPESDEDKDSNSTEFQPVKAPLEPRRVEEQVASPDPVPVIRKPQMSLLNSCKQSWKPRHNHFARYSDVRPKEERKRTVNEIANQKQAMQRVNGWKVVHLSGQVEDLVSVESDINRRLKSLLSSIEKRQQCKKPYKDFDKDVNRLSELFKANMQRSIIIKDQMTEAKCQMSNIFNHKENIVNILVKYGNKRALRKKEKL